MKALLLGLLILLFLIFPAKAFAANVVINEVFANPSGPSSEPTEFIELFNKGQEPADITDWKISDTVGSTKTYIIPENTLAPGGFIAFSREASGITLNNSRDGVVLRNADDEEVDSMSYDSSIEDRSWSRVPDGTGDFVNNTDTTRGFANVVPPTPTPTITPTPTKPPTPTKTPTATKIPSPTPTVPFAISSPAQEQHDQEDGENNSELQLATEYRNDIFSNETNDRNENKTEVLGESTNKTPLLFIGLGLIFIAVCAILAYFQFGDKIRANFNKNSDTDIL